MIHSNNPWKNSILHMTDGLMINISVTDLKKMLNEPRCVVCKKDLVKTGICSHDCAKMMTRELLTSHPMGVSNAIEEYNAYMKHVAKDNLIKKRKRK